jgi:hypothetical protein
MASPDLPAPTEGFVLTHFIVAQDVGAPVTSTAACSAARW